jgi:hypothetical protein
MKKLDLFKLRKKGGLTFNTPKGLISKIGEIMTGSQIPLVYGYSEFEPKGNWNLAYLKPLKDSDELTIKNFLEGIKEIDKKDQFKNFLGTIDYTGAESMHYSNERQQILGITVNEKNNSSRTYCIEITLQKNSTYSAKAISYVSDFEKFMEKHLGPNKDSE